MEEQEAGQKDDPDGSKDARLSWIEVSILQAQKEKNHKKQKWNYQRRCLLNGKWSARQASCSSPSITTTGSFC